MTWRVAVLRLLLAPLLVLPLPVLLVLLLPLLVLLLALLLGLVGRGLQGAWQWQAHEGERVRIHQGAAS